MRKVKTVSLIPLFVRSTAVPKNIVPAAVHAGEAGVQAVQVESPVLGVRVRAHLKVGDNVRGKEAGQDLKKMCTHITVSYQSWACDNFLT